MKLKISAKIIILTLVLISVAIIIGIYAISGIDKIDKNVDTLYNDRVVPLEQLKNISDAYAVQFVDVSHKVADGLITKNQAQKELNEAEKIVDENWDAYMATMLTDEEQRLANQAIELRKTSANAFEKLNQIINIQDDSIFNREIDRFNQNELYQSVDPFTEKIAELIALQVQIAHQLHTESTEIYEVTQNITISFIIGGVLLGGFIALFIILNVAGILKKINTEINALINNSLEGKLSSRGNAKIIDPEFRYIIEGFNDVLDAVISPLNVAAEYIDRISKGNMPPKITDEYQGDFNEIKNNLNQCIDAVNLLVQDADMLTGAATDGDFETRADVSKHDGDFKKIVTGVNETLDVVVNKVFWYEQMLDSIPFPISVTDMNMNWTFFNKAAEQVTGLSRKEMLGKQCSNWGADICKTENCGINLLRKGTLLSSFKQPGVD